jgi:NAD(P) transhydrogenase alpha subunit
MAFSKKKEIPKFVFGVPKETYPDERRVAASPDSVKLLVKDGHKVMVQSGAGDKASFSDEAYRAQGAEILSKVEDVYSSADIVLKVRAPEESQVNLLTADKTLVSFLWPA